MRICSQPPRPPQGPPRGSLRPVLTVAGGAVGASYGALGGGLLAQTYGPRLLDQAVPHVLNAIGQGAIQADTALRAVHWLAQPGNQAFAGAISLGLVGAVSGAALTYALLS
ncbi:hypothetical protein JST97_08520 [bacterium]|nr:hypothetical protein [bacterium]